MLTLASTEAIAPERRKETEGFHTINLGPLPRSLCVLPVPRGGAACAEDKSRSSRQCKDARQCLHLFLPRRQVLQWLSAKIFCVHRENASNDHCVRLQDPGEGFTRADDLQLKKRKIFRARRGGQPAPAPVSAEVSAAGAPAGSNPFAGISLTPAAAGNPFTGVSLAAPAAVKVSSSLRYRMSAQTLLSIKVPLDQVEDAACVLKRPDLSSEASLPHRYALQVAALR